MVVRATVTLVFAVQSAAAVSASTDVMFEISVNKISLAFQVTFERVARRCEFLFGV